jgi:hypothetical protein
MAEAAAQPPQTEVRSPEPVASIAERSALVDPQAPPPGQGSNWLVTPAEAQKDPPPAPSQPGVHVMVQERIVPDERGAQPLVVEAKAADLTARAGFGPFQFGLVVLTAICLLAGAGLYLAGARHQGERRAILDLNAKAPLRRPDTRVRSISPRSPTECDTLEDAQAAIEARLRQFAQAWKRQAA